MEEVGKQIKLFFFDRSSAGIEGKSISSLMKLIQVRIDFCYSYNSEEEDCLLGEDRLSLVKLIDPPFFILILT